MNWANFHWLWAVFLPAVIFGTLVVSALLRRREPAVRWPGITRVVASGTSIRPVRAGREIRRPWLLVLALLGTILALARPRWGQIEKPVFEQAREVMIALDLSRSMLVEDIPPRRMDRARLLVQSLLSGLKGERVGLIVFAGTAFVQVPLSADYEILKEFLPELAPGYLPQGGTDYEGMVKAALGGFSETADTDRYLIVLSDGEALDEGWRKLTPKLRERHVRVLTLGLGTPAGGFIPDPKSGYVKDERGAVVLSRMEPATLQALASETDGAYRDASVWVDLPALLADTVARGRQGGFTEKRDIDYIERFQWFLGPAVLIGLLGLLREIAPRPKARDVVLSHGAKATLALATATVSLLALTGRNGFALGEGGPKSASDQIRETVSRLADAGTQRASDWRDLAEQTLAYGNETMTTGQPPEPGVIHDAIAAVDAGKQISPNLTDWAALRSSLEKFLEPPEDREKEEDEQQQDQDKNRQQDEQDQSGKDQQGDPGQEDSPKSEEEQKDSGDQNQPDEQERQSGEQQQQDPSRKDGDTEQTPRPRGEELGDLDKPEEEEPAQQQEPQQQEPAPPKSQKTRRIGGKPADEREQPPPDAETAAALQRLRQAQDGDSPARLFELLEGKNEKAAASGRDW